MIKLSLTIESDNDSVKDGKHTTEIATILRNLAAAVESGMEGDFAVMDINGNSIGNGMLEVWE